MKILDTFVINLKKYRLKAGLTQEELAFRSGLHRTYISALECKRRNISIENIEKLADALEIEVYKLFLVNLEDVNEGK